MLSVIALISILLIFPLIMIPFFRTNSAVAALLSKKKTYKMIVFIHGTITPHPSLKVFRAWIKNKKNRSYQGYIDVLRTKGPHSQQAIGVKGLQQITLPPSKDNDFPEMPSQIIARLYDNIAHQCTAGNKNEGRFYYTFGWSGSLNQGSRLKWGKRLYQALIEEQVRLKKIDPNGKISLTILAHSHGGNVALNLAQAEEVSQKKLVINNLVLFGTPIQSETSHLVTKPTFKRVFNIYSPSDRIQVIDSLSTNDKRSKRSFFRKNTPNASIKNLTEIEVSVNTKTPSHGELWMLGTNVPFWFYRKKFPLYPLPVAIFTPLIIRKLKRFAPPSPRIILTMSKKDDTVACTFQSHPTYATDKNYRHTCSVQIPLFFKNIDKK